ncbi:hypothetical protein ACFYVL_09305 [Streptomyces sp. NPDC004111]|uniref:hypothetical protein n=1 Tax=Streptomyces sp. NPDC004111 TaxID=3364690 RepID=UPI0036CFD193
MDLEDQLRDVAGVLHALAHQLAMHRTAAGDTGGTVTARRAVAAMTRAAPPVGHALATLAEAVEQVGLLHLAAAMPRSADRADAFRAAHAVLDDRFEGARLLLNDAGRQLHRDAERLTAPSRPARRPSPGPAAQPAAPPATARTR